jgi:hypothetical protein
MSQVTPKMREFAERLVAHETRVDSSGEKSRAAFLVCEKLRPQLATLMGNAGFRALLLRALALANGEAAALRTLRVNVNGSLEGLEELTAQVDADEIARGGVVLVTQFLGLLETFIGENLTVHLVREVWPKLLFDKPGSD